MSDADERLQHLLRLARLELPPSEADAVAADLDVLLGYLARLQELDVDDEPEWTPPLAPASVMRPDSTTPSLPRAAALALAPNTQDDFFRVPRILDDA